MNKEKIIDWEQRKWEAVIAITSMTTSNHLGKCRMESIVREADDLIQTYKKALYKETEKSPNKET